MRNWGYVAPEFDRFLLIGRWRGGVLMFAFVDTETTGFAQGGVQPCIVSIAWMIADGPGTPRHFQSHIVRPDGFVIPYGAAAVHGISTQRAEQEGRPLRAVMQEFSADLLALRPSHIIAHNARYDMPVIAAEFDRLGLADPCQRLAVQCTMLMARRKWPGMSAKLGDVHSRLFRSPMQNAHDAGADVRACSKVFFAIDTNRPIG